MDDCRWLLKPTEVGYVRAVLRADRAFQRVLLGADICNSGDGKVTELQCTILRLCLSQATEKDKR